MAQSRSRCSAELGGGSKWVSKLLSSSPSGEKTSPDLSPALTALRPDFTYRQGALHIFSGSHRPLRYRDGDVHNGIPKNNSTEESYGWSVDCTPATAPAQLCTWSCPVVRAESAKPKI